MRRHLPPLPTLLAFSAASRHLSFSKAAVELNLTQSAISRQIRGLEETLGADLFVRLTRRLELTDFGRDYLHDIETALASLEQATARAVARTLQRTLTIDALPSIASHWLMPRLADFTRQHAEIDVHLVTSTDPARFPDTHPCAAIRVGTLPGQGCPKAAPRIDLDMVGDWRGVVAEPLFRDVLVPVCAPRLLADRVVERPEHLLSLPRIHTTSRMHAWSDWFRACGIDDPDTAPRHRYGHFFMSLAAARAGEGVALLPHILLQQEPLGDLVKLFPPRVSSAGDYHLLMLEKHRDRPEMQAFRGWLHAQIIDTPLDNLSGCARDCVRRIPAAHA